MIVMKFGGTSVGDASAIRRTVDIIAGRAPRAPVVVLSALGGATSELLAMAAQAASGNLVSAIAQVESLRTRHLRVLYELLGDGPETNDLAADESALFDELAHLSEALSVLGHVTPRSLDAFAAVGERASAPIVVAALVRAGVVARHVDARDVMVTDAAFGRAEPREELIALAAREHVAALVRDGCVPVLGGYIGATKDGITTTLGRGGSDFSAALVGAALEAEAIEIWTDVDGLLTADPKVVEDARLIEHIRFDEAAELATFGAKVLHPSTIAPAVRRGIPVFIFNSHRPSGNGTRITFDAPRSAVRAIAGKSNVVIVKVRSHRMLAAPGILRGIFEVFERNKTSVDVVATSEVSVSLTVDDDQYLDDVVAQLRVFGDVGVERGRGIVALVGAGLGESSPTMARALAAVGDVRLHMLSLSATGINLTLIVDATEVSAIMCRLHDEFFPRRSAA
ncbi:MAG: aspartate kinase [Gemmatimonadetes bacterium]|nr:aspartate kinase [Gemmatimonadota bacterium]